MYYKLKKFFYIKWLIYKGVKIDRTIQGFNFLFGNFKGLKLGRSIWIESGAKLIIGKEEAILSIGDFSYINSFTIIDCHHNINIGKRTQIGPHCYIGDFDHSIRVDFRNLLNHRASVKYSSVIIEDNVWIGAGVKILRGVTIGRNAVIGAGSIVINNIPANAVAVGNPAKVIKIVKDNFDFDDFEI
jgi:acetyltransferase-like isoleucine patch superfamily enzyme